MWNCGLGDTLYVDHVSILEPVCFCKPLAFGVFLMKLFSFQKKIYIYIFKCIKLYDNLHQHSIYITI